MVETAPSVDLYQFAYPGKDQEPSLDKARQFVNHWQDSLIHIVNTVWEKEGYFIAAKDEIIKGINSWATEDPNQPDHGGYHSYFVYEGMRTITSQDGRQAEVSDELMQAMAVLHDMIQSMPAVDFRTGAEDKGMNVRDIHAHKIALIARSFGKSLGLNQTELRELIHGVGHHDDVYTGETFTPKHYSAAVLSDADKLFGARIEFDAQESTRTTLQRNLNGASKADGWYLIRRDLQPSERKQWQYGHRWISDAISAVRRDFFDMEFLTETGRKLAQQRRDEFMPIMREVYGDFYDRQAILVERWINGEKAQVCGKGEHPPAIDDLSPSEVIEKLTHTRLKLPAKYLKNNLDDLGWKLQIGQPPEVIDSSVAQFMFDDQDQFNPDQEKAVFFQALEDHFTSQE